MDTLKCTRCDSEKIIPNIRIVDRWGHLEDDYLAIEIKQNPKALIFKDTHRELISADVCGECGYVSLSVDNPKGLWDAHVKKQNS